MKLPREVMNWMSGTSGDNARRWFLTIAGVAVLVVLALRAERLDGYWVTILGAMMGLGMLAIGGSSSNPTTDGKSDDNRGNPGGPAGGPNGASPGASQDVPGPVVGRERDTPEAAPRVRDSRRGPGGRTLAVHPGF